MLRIDMGGRDRLHLPGQLLQLKGDRAQLGGVDFGIDSGLAGAGGVEQRIEHQRDARQDRLFDALERLVDPELAVFAPHSLKATGTGLTGGKIQPAVATGGDAL